MSELEQEIDAVAAERGFTGVVRVDVEGKAQLSKAFGLAHRGFGIANTETTRFGTASGGKGFTALAIVSLIEDGVLSLDTTARSVLGDDLPLIGPDVTVEHLLEHRSGIGDYIDEEGDWEVEDYVLPVPVHELVTTEQFLRVLDGFPAKFAAGEQFSYCNGGYVVLALIAERSSGVPYHDLVRQRVFDRAGMPDTGFPRSDEPDGRTACGYLHSEGLRTNIFHLPVVATGDGGVHTTAADMAAFWPALFAGRIVSSDWVERMTHPRNDVPSESLRYGLGFWIHETRPVVMVGGYDAGASFRSVHDPHRQITHTVLSNYSEGAWPVTGRLDKLLIDV